MVQQASGGAALFGFIILALCIYLLGRFFRFLYYRSKRKKQAKAIKYLMLAMLRREITSDRITSVIKNSHRSFPELISLLRSLQIITESLEMALSSANPKTAKSRMELVDKTYARIREDDSHLLSSDEWQQIDTIIQEARAKFETRYSVNTSRNSYSDSTNSTKGLFSVFNEQSVKKIKRSRTGKAVYVEEDNFRSWRTFESSNKLYTLALMDADGQGNGGYRESGNGKYLLAKCDDVLLLRCDVERPMEGGIADNGSFVIGDTLFGTNTNSILYAYDLSGRSLLKHHLNANLINVGISDDGNYGVCQCAGGDEFDGDQLKLFDLNKGLLLWSCKPVGGLADKYDFKEGMLILIHCRREQAVYRHSLLDGSSPDHAKWETDRLATMDGDGVLEIARTKFKNWDKQDQAVASEILEIVTTALQRGFIEPLADAKAYRLRGEVFEVKGDITEAIACFQKALEINPSVGVKRKLSLLLKTVKDH